jgi:hypothetical protein
MTPKTIKNILTLFRMVDSEKWNEIYHPEYDESKVTKGLWIKRKKNDTSRRKSKRNI